MQHSKTDINIANKDFGDYQWLCEFLGISVHTARRWVSEGRVPYLKLAGGSLVRFKKSDIVAWLESSKTEAYNE
jgi:excisionase family DNA binding protein